VQRRIVPAAAALALALTGASAGRHEEDPRFDGEYSLWARWQGDSLAVSWITVPPSAGMLKVTVDGRTRLDVKTSVDSGHTAVLADAKGDAVVLTYGRADGTGMQSTTIHKPEDGKARVIWPAADSIVVVSDIHGEFDRLIRVLRNASLIGPGLEWTGGHRNLVVVGDVFDRGADATRILWFLYQLEPQAQHAGGRLHMMLGNHEIMVMTGDLRYVSAKESEIARLYHTTYDRLFDPRNSVLGEWLLEKPALLRIGDILFAHGGVSAEYAAWTLKQYEDSLSSFSREELFARWADTTFIAPVDSAGLARRDDFFWGPRSVFWFRDYVQSDTLGAELDAVLTHFGAKIAVVGHTPQPTITERYGGRLIAVNTFPFINEALLLVRQRDGWARYRIRETGRPEPIEPAVDRDGTIPASRS
jgi:Calcineurin-like phosphoesterase